MSLRLRKHQKRGSSRLEDQSDPVLWVPSIGVQKKKMSWKIYALKDPLTGEFRYIGKAKDPKTRMRYYKSTSSVGKWIASLKGLKTKPDVVILEEGKGSEWGPREKHWISVYREKGEPLLNRCSGGNGSHNKSSALPDHLVPDLGVVPDRVLAEKVGLTRKAVSYHRARLGIPPAPQSSRKKASTCFQKGLEPHNKKLPPEADSLLGTTWDSELAERFGVHKVAIARRRKKLGVPVYTPKRAKRRHSKLFPKDVLYARSSGKRPQRLASELGVSVCTIYRVLSRETWQDI